VVRIALDDGLAGLAAGRKIGVSGTRRIQHLGRHWSSPSDMTNGGIRHDMLQACDSEIFGEDSGSLVQGYSKGCR